MHQLTETLLAAQRHRTSVPFVEATLAPRWGGVTQLRWERIDAGAGEQPDDPHAAVISTRSGTLIRIRAQANPNGLFVQRTPSPGPGAQFGTWQNLGATSATGGVAGAEIDGRIHVFDVAPNLRDLQERTSRDDGVTFGSPRTIATTTSTVTSVTAASGPGGSALILFADSGGNLRSMARMAGAWTIATPWSNTLSGVDGVACAHIDGDWAVVVCGTLADGSSGVWTCVLGAGSSQTAGTWSLLREVIASAVRRRRDVSAAEPLHGRWPADQLCGSVRSGVNVYTQTLTTHALRPPRVSVIIVGESHRRLARHPGRARL